MLAGVLLGGGSRAHQGESDEAFGEVIRGDAASNVRCEGGVAAGFSCRGVNLLSFMPAGQFGPGVMNEVWGWTDDASGREFVMVGRTDAVEFVEVTDPINPTHIGTLPSPAGSKSSYWNDMKVYGDYAYIVSDFTQHGMEVFDLSQLLPAVEQPATFTASTIYDGFSKAHNIAINEETGFAYAVGTRTCDGGLHIIDLAAPLDPQFAACFSDTGYAHDTQCVVYQGPDEEHAGKDICFNANLVDGRLINPDNHNSLVIVDVGDPEDAELISDTDYPNSGWAHQGWLTEDHRYFLMDDESDEILFDHNTRTIIFDVSDLDEPFVVGEFIGPTRTVDHNLFIKGSLVYQANYAGGMRILEIGDLAELEISEVAFFDTYPENDLDFPRGAWGVYPFFNSGTIAVSDINRGLFLLALPEPSTETLRVAGLMTLFLLRRLRSRTRGEPC